MAIVKMLHRACIDAGAAEEDGGDGFVKREDIVRCVVVQLMRARANR